MNNETTTWRRIAILAALLAAGAFYVSYSTRGPEPEPTERRDAPKSRPAAPKDATEVVANLAWFLHLEPRETGRDERILKTAWISKDGSVRKMRNGLFVTVAGRLWEYRFVSAEKKLMDCRCFQRERDETDCIRNRKEIELVSFLDVAEAKSHTISLEQEFGERDRFPDATGSLDIFHVPRASVGSLLVTTRCTYEHFCGGAHGGTSCALVAWDLDDAEPKQRSGLSDEIRKTGASLKEQSVPVLENRPIAKVERGEVELTAAWPVWTDGKASMSYQFSHPASYAGSDDRWSSYSVSVRIESEEFPDDLSAFRDVPDGVAAFWNEHTPLDGQGYSQVSASNQERLWKAFESDGG